MHIWLHTDEIVYRRAQLGIQGNKKIDGLLWAGIDLTHKLSEHFAGLVPFQIWCEINLQLRVIGEWKGFSFRFEEKIEGIDDDHVGNQVNLNVKLAGFLRKDQTAKVVIEGILLPVEKMLFRGHLH